MSLHTTRGSRYRHLCHPLQDPQGGQAPPCSYDSILRRPKKYSTYTRAANKLDNCLAAQTTEYWLSTYYEKSKFYKDLINPLALVTIRYATTLISLKSVRSCHFALATPLTSCRYQMFSASAGYKLLLRFGMGSDMPIKLVHLYVCLAVLILGYLLIRDEFSSYGECMHDWKIEAEATESVCPGCNDWGKSKKRASRRCLDYLKPWE